MLTVEFSPEIEVEQKLSVIDTTVYVTVPVLEGVTLIGLPVIRSFPFISARTLNAGLTPSVIVMLNGAEPVNVNPRSRFSPKHIWLSVLKLTVGKSCTMTFKSSKSAGQLEVAAIVFLKI